MCIREQNKIVFLADASAKGGCGGGGSTPPPLKNVLFLKKNFMAKSSISGVSCFKNIYIHLTDSELALNFSCHKPRAQGKYSPLVKPY